MGVKTEAETRLTRYLLGTVSDRERELLEAEYFSDEDAFQKMLTAEDDLTDAYARGELSLEDRRRFENRFLNSAKGRERVQFARTLAAAVPDSRPVEKQPVWASDAPRPGFFASLGTRGLGLSFATVAVVLIGATTMLFVDRRSMRNELDTLRAERDRLSESAADLERTIQSEKNRSDESAEQIKSLQQQLVEATARPAERPRGSTPGTNRYVAGKRTPQDQKAAKGTEVAKQQRDTGPGVMTAFVTLNPGGVRSVSGGGNKLTIDKFERVFFTLVVENREPSATYRAFIETAEGNPVTSIDSFTPTGRPDEPVVSLPALPTADFRSGVYVLTLEMKQADGSFRKVAEYSFTVIRK